MLFNSFSTSSQKIPVSNCTITDNIEVLGYLEMLPTLKVQKVKYVHQVLVYLYSTTGAEVTGVPL